MTGLPPATVCPAPSCSVPVRTVPTTTSKAVTVTAEPSPNGAVWLHDVAGEIRAQPLGQDAAKALRSAGIGLHRDHRTDCRPGKARR